MSYTPPPRRMSPSLSFRDSVRGHSGTLAQPSLPTITLGPMARLLLHVLPLYGEDAVRGDHPDLR
jgi:hypothetical protein